VRVSVFFWGRPPRIVLRYPISVSLFYFSRLIDGQPPPGRSVGRLTRFLINGGQDLPLPDTRRPPNDNLGRHRECNPGLAGGLTAAAFDT